MLFSVLPYILWFINVGFCASAITLVLIDYRINHDKSIVVEVLHIMICLLPIFVFGIFNFLVDKIRFESRLAGLIFTASLIWSSFTFTLVFSRVSNHGLKKLFPALFLAFSVIVSAGLFLFYFTGLPRFFTMLQLAAFAVSMAAPPVVILVRIFWRKPEDFPVYCILPVKSGIIFSLLSVLTVFLGFSFPELSDLSDIWDNREFIYRYYGFVFGFLDIKLLLFMIIHLLGISYMFIVMVFHFRRIRTPDEDKKDVAKILQQFPITSKEREILLLLIEGLSYRDIADRMNLSLATVKSHATSIYKKTQEKSRNKLLKSIQSSRYNASERPDGKDLSKEREH
jgi:DNA-binding CsgD family transcriptional regulator